MAAGDLSTGTVPSGMTSSWSEDALCTNSAVAIKASAGSVSDVFCDNSQGSGTVYVQLFDKAAASVALGTDKPIWAFPVRAGKKGGCRLRDILGNAHAAFATAISLACTTAVGNNTAPSGTAPSVKVLFS